MGGIVVDDQMDVQVFRHVLVNMAKELEKFLVAMSALTLVKNLASGHFKCGEQSGGPISLVIMGPSFHIAQIER